MRLRVLPLFAITAAAVVVVGAAPAVAAPVRPAAPAAPSAIPDSSAYGAYYADTPRRIFDTRSAGNSRLGQGRSVVIPITVSSVAHPSAVVLNLTVVNPSTSGYLTAYPAGQALPRTSSINFTRGRTIANLVTVPVSASGSIVIYNGLGSTDVVVDELGGYSADTAASRGRGGGYVPADPDRLLDTRSDGGGPLLPGYYAPITVRFQGTGRTISALAVNITVTNTRASGYLTAWNGATNQPPRVSSLNFTKGITAANAAIVPTSECTTSACGGDAAKIAVLNGSGGNVDVVVDLLGFYGSASLTAPVRYQPLTSPVRIVDSRSNLGGVTKLGPGATQSFSTPASVAGKKTVGIDANVTLVKPTASTYLTLWPKIAGLGRPTASTVNAGTGQVISNHAIQEVSKTGHAVNVYNFNGLTDIVVDVSGTFENIARQAGKDAPSHATLTVVGTSVPQRADLG